MDLATLGIQVTSGPAVKGAADLDKLTVAAAKAEVKVQDLAASSARLGPALGGVSRAAGGLSTNARMLSQQLSQVGQMTMVTGNFAQALAVQLPDIGLAFGAIGAAAGLVAGVALPMVIAAFSGTSDSAERLKEALDASDEAVKRFAASSQAANATIDDLAAKYGGLAAQVRLALDAIAAADEKAAVEAIRASIAALNGTLLETVTAREAILAGGGLRQLSDDYGLLKSEAAAVRDALVAMETAGSMPEAVSAAMRLMNALNGARDEAGKLPPELQAAYDNAAKIVPQAAQVATNTSDAADEAARLEQRMADAYGMYAMTRNMAASLANETERAAAAALAAMKIEFSGGGQAQMKYGSRAPGGNSAQDALADRYAPPKVPAGAGGGGSVAEDFASRLQGITEGLQTERETIDAWYADAQTILADRRAQEILGEEGHKQALIALEQKYQGELVALKEQEGALVRSAASNMYTELGGLLTAFGGKSKAAAVAAIILNKGLRIAEIIQNTAAAQMRAFAELGPIAGAAAAAKIGMFGKLQAGIVAATGLAQISGAGGGGGGGVPSTGPAAQAVQPQQQPQQTLIVQGIKANDIFTGQMIYDMFMGEGRLRGAPVVQLMR